MSVATAKDFYKVLGVSEKASKEDIRKAYLALAKKYHPDKTGGDKAAEERLKEINEAYDTLKNDLKRKEYDEMRANPFFGAGAYGNGPQGGFGAQGGFNAQGFEFGGGFEDILSGIFGSAGAGARAYSRPLRGHDIEAPLEVSLEEASTGVSKSIHLRREVACAACGGSGAEAGSKPVVCPACQGTGQASRGNGTVFVSKTCPKCHGRGQYIESPCKACAGAGQCVEPTTLSVTVPAGAATGTRLRLAGQGGAGERGGPSGDLFVAVRVREHPIFKREGDDLICEATVTFPQAALGATIHVPTLKGKAKLQIPAGTQPGRLLRMRGLGMPSLHRKGAGDQLVKVQVEVPRKLTKEQRELVKRLGELQHAKPNTSA